MWNDTKWMAYFGKKKTKKQKPQANDPISLGMIESDLVLWLVFLLLVSTSSKIKEKHIQIPARTVKQRKANKNWEKLFESFYLYCRFSELNKCSSDEHFSLIWLVHGHLVGYCV